MLMELLQACKDNDMVKVRELYSKVTVDDVHKVIKHDVHSEPIIYLCKGMSFRDLNKTLVVLCEQNKLELIKKIHKHVYSDIFYNNNLLHTAIKNNRNNIVNWILKQPPYIATDSLIEMSKMDDLTIFKNQCKIKHRYNNRLIDSILNSNNALIKIKCLNLNNSIGVYIMNKSNNIEIIQYIYDSGITREYLYQHLTSMLAITYICMNHDVDVSCFEPDFYSVVLNNVITIAKIMKKKDLQLLFNKLIEIKSFNVALTLYDNFKQHVNINTNDMACFKALINNRCDVTIQTISYYFNHTIINNNVIPVMYKKRKRKQDCVVCYEKTNVVLPCDHVICSKCYSNLTTKLCPLCREQILYFKHV